MNSFCIGVDVGGSHLTTAVVESTTNSVLEKTISRSVISTDINNKDFLKILVKNIQTSYTHAAKINQDNTITGIGFAFPGPFDYNKGICKIQGVSKFEKLFGCAIRTACFSALQKSIGIAYDNIQFLNDAQAFLLGAVVQHKLEKQNVIGITIGTGIGSAFYKNGHIIENGNEVPPHGYLYNMAFKNGIAEDYISTRWFLKNFAAVSVEEIAKAAGKGDTKAFDLFKTFGVHLAEIILPWIKKFKADTIVFGGGMVHAWHLINESFRKKFAEQKIHCNIILTTGTEQLNILGAAKNIKNNLQDTGRKFRKTEQYLLPQKKQPEHCNGYDIYPTNKIAGGNIYQSLENLVSFFPEEGNIIIDGYGGVFWDEFITDLSEILAEKNIQANWFCVDAALKPADKIDELIHPYLHSDGEQSIFGKCYTGSLIDFFDEDKLQKINPSEKNINILYGCGAALANWNGTHIYIDIPKNEIQYRSRAGTFKNIGASGIENARSQYKRCYFIDWIVLNMHKQTLLPKIDFIIDGQHTEFYSFTTGNALFNTLKHLSRHPFRARPWFEPGVWGGHWIKENIPLIAQDVPNYAWSFELIYPENGLLFEDNGAMLEVSFDWLMFAHANEMLGNSFKIFGVYFPIRFDYLDTMDGDNLSIQCHPSLNYIKENFGEIITQDETYYILDCADDAKVYLGFRENINAAEFKAALMQSKQTAEKISIEKYVQKHDAHKHDLFLIPNQTIHGSGKNNMVLEISNTPYIFTFKLYDWVRMDLDGKPRPINIEHGMKNLDFSRKGDIVSEFISQPVLIEQGNNFSHWHLPTHTEHIYDVERYEWEGTINISTNDQCNLLMLVEGSQISVNTNGEEKIFHYAETIVVPAATKNYAITFPGKGKAKLIKAFIKDSFVSDKIKSQHHGK